MNEREEKTAMIKPGDYIEYRGLYALERLGPVSVEQGPGGMRRILVPGRITRYVPIEPKRIRAIVRNGEEIARFEEA